MRGSLTKKYQLVLLTILFIFTCCHIARADEVNYNKQAADKIINFVTNKYKYSRSYADYILNKAKYNPRALDDFNQFLQMSWPEYKAEYLPPDLIEHGLDFWKTRWKVLKWAQRYYGIPARIFAAYIGVASDYGNRMGHFKEADVIKTLAFYNPNQHIAKFYQQEFENFLLMVREYSKNPFRLNGNFQGKMGIVQFLPTSYLYYIKNFTMGHTPNIYRNFNDAIFSIGNHLMQNFWRKYQPALAPAKIHGEGYKQLLSTPNKYFTLAQLQRLGVTPNGPTDNDGLAKFLVLNNNGQEKYYLTFHNFDVLKYGNGKNFALAVVLFSHQLQAQRNQRLEELELKKQQKTQKKSS